MTGSMIARRVGSIAVIVATVLSTLMAPPALSSGNQDAAHACQKGGYLTLQGTDGTTFKNAGECVSFVARGGTITNVSTTCSYTAGASGCVVLDDVVVPVGTTGTGSTSTTLAGMFTFAPITTWSYGTTVTVSGSGTWVASTGGSGTWTANAISSIYPTQFTAGSPTTCDAADTRYVGVHMDVYAGGSLVGALEVQVRDATSGTDFLQYQGFTASPSGEPWGIHTTTAVDGVSLYC